MRNEVGLMIVILEVPDDLVALSLQDDYKEAKNADTPEKVKSLVIEFLLVGLRRHITDRACNCHWERHPNPKCPSANFPSHRK